MEGCMWTMSIISLNSLSTSLKIYVSLANCYLISSLFKKILTNILQFFYTFNHSLTTASTLFSFSLHSLTWPKKNSTFFPWLLIFIRSIVCASMISIIMSNGRNVFVILSSSITTSSNSNTCLFQVYSMFFNFFSIFYSFWLISTNSLIAFSCLCNCNWSTSSKLKWTELWSNFLPVRVIN